MKRITYWLIGHTSVANSTRSGKLMTREASKQESMLHADEKKEYIPRVPCPVIFSTKSIQKWRFLNFVLFFVVKGSNRIFEVDPR